MIGPRLIDKPLVLYGYGCLGHLAEEIFMDIGMPHLIVDQSDHTNIPNKNKHLLAICVANEPYSQIIAPLRSAGWTDLVPVWDIIEAYPECGIRNGWFVGELTKEDQENISTLKWTDKESYNHYWAFLAWHKWHDEMDIRIEPAVPWLSTLEDIRMRQVVQLYSLHLPVFRIHAEGCELETIKENLALFQRCRPSIEVTCYHSRDGLWAIEKMLMDNFEDYNFKFRLHAYCGQAAVMYAVPHEIINERKQ